MCPNAHNSLENILNDNTYATLSGPPFAQYFIYITFGDFE